MAEVTALPVRARVDTPAYASLPEDAKLEILDTHVPHDTFRYLGARAVLREIQQGVVSKVADKDGNVPDDPAYKPVKSILNRYRDVIGTVDEGMAALSDRQRSRSRSLFNTQFGADALPPYLRTLYQQNGALPQPVLEQAGSTEQAPKKAKQPLMPDISKLSDVQLLNLLEWHNYQSIQAEARLAQTAEMRKRLFSNMLGARHAELGLDEAWVAVARAKVAETQFYVPDAVLSAHVGKLPYYNLSKEGGRGVAITKNLLEDDAALHELGHAVEGVSDPDEEGYAPQHQRGLLRLYDTSPDAPLPEAERQDLREALDELQEAVNELFMSSLKNGHPTELSLKHNARKDVGYRGPLEKLRRICRSGAMQIDPRLFMRVMVLDGGEQFEEARADLLAQLQKAHPNKSIAELMRDTNPKPARTGKAKA